MTPKQIADAIIKFRAKQLSKQNLNNTFITMLDLEQQQSLIDAIKISQRDYKIESFTEATLQDEIFMAGFSKLMIKRAGMLSLEDSGELLALQKNIADTFPRKFELDESTEGQVHFSV